MEKPFEYWQELYLEHAKTSQFRKKVDNAVVQICKFIDTGVRNPVVNWSGGKDSTALAHLVCNLSAVNCKVCSEKDDMDFPAEKEYVIYTAEKFGWNLDIIEPSVSIWETLKSYDFTEDIHSSDTDFGKLFFYDLLRKYQKDNDVKGVFIGLRMQESKGRKLNGITKGHIYYNNAEAILVCQPLSDWSAADVFAYLFSHDIPILDVYFKTKFAGSPENIRKSWVLPSAQSAQGQAMWLKYYYPELFVKLSSVNPKLRTYV